MKINITPGFITGATFDDVTAAAIMKMHKPRAVKIANAKNLLALLAQRNGTARVRNSETFSTDRWFDCNPETVSTIEPVSQPPVPVRLESTVGILTSETVVNAVSDYAAATQTICLYIPLNPADTATVSYAGRGIYPNWGVPTILYFVEFV